MKRTHIIAAAATVGLLPAGAALASTPPTEAPSASPDSAAPATIYNDDRNPVATVSVGATEVGWVGYGEDDAPDEGNEYLRMTVTVTNGMVTPVNGVMKSTFGPRKHPILGVVRIHKGVDWAAPVGTPVFAAFDGEIAFAGDGEDYGNLIKIAHGKERETRYAHLSRFAQNARPGETVKARSVNTRRSG